MRIAYHVYRNDGRSGPVDYANPIAATADCRFACPAPAGPSDTTFAVRAVDLDTGIEEANTEARARLVLDAQGRDVTRRPGPVRGLAARVVPTSSCRVVWNYEAPPGSVPPARFALSLTAGAVPDLTAVRADVPFDPRATGYETVIDRVPENTACVLAVWAVGADPGLSGDPAVVPLHVAVARLRDVDDLAGTALA